MILSPLPAPRRPSLRLSLEKVRFWPAVAIGLMLSLALCVPALPHLWSTGFMRDPDDAMRLVFLHQWMEGHSWYNTTIARFDPPLGVHMHWSHVIDVPLALLYHFFHLFCDDAHAEVLMRISYPVLLQGAVLASNIRSSDRIFGTRFRFLTLCATVFSGAFLGQFPLGRVDHHSAQILLLSLMCTCLATGLIKTRGIDVRHKNLWAMAALAVCMTLSLAISVENMPFIIVIAAGLPLLWGVYGHTYKHELRVFGAALALCAVLIFASFYDPAYWLVSYADAMSLAHVCALVVGGGLLALITYPPLSKQPHRFIALALAGLAWLVFIAVFFPLLLRDPYQGLDPQVRQFWLDHVSEVQNIFEFYKSEGVNAFAFVAPLVLSCLSLGVLAYRLPRQHQRNVLIMLVALVLIGIGTEVVMIRVFSFTTIISVFGTLALSRLINIAPVLPQLHSAPRRLWAGLAALIITSPMLWVLVMGIVGRDDAAAQSEAKAGQACYERSSYSFLAHLPRGRILNYHEIGSHILLYTHHDIESAPYHRANHGNRLAFDVFASAPSASAHALKANGIHYLVFCDADHSITHISQAYPEGTLALLLRQQNLPFLELLDDKGPLHIWRVH